MQQQLQQFLETPRVGRAIMAVIIFNAIKEFIVGDDIMEGLISVDGTEAEEGVIVGGLIVMILEELHDAQTGPGTILSRGTQVRSAKELVRINSGHRAGARVNGRGRVRVGKRSSIHRGSTSIARCWSRTSRYRRISGNERSIIIIIRV